MTTISTAQNQSKSNRQRATDVHISRHADVKILHGALTFSLHAHAEALLIATVLTAITLSLVNDAVFLVTACILQLLADCTLEEPLAALTTDNVTTYAQ